MSGPVVAVVGAGPAGLAAAVSALDSGATVVLLDAADDVGGQYWRHLPDSRPVRRAGKVHHDWSRFIALRQRLERESRCEVVTSAHVWAIEAMTLHVLEGEADGTNRRHRTWTPDAIILANGAYDRALPVPGWDLPGVFTIGGAQALAKGERVAVGQRVVLSGSGPFLLPVASVLERTGASVVGVFEASNARRLAHHWLARPWEILRSLDKVGELGGYAGTFIRHGVRYRTGHGVTAIHGDERVTAVTVSALDSLWRPVAGSDRTVEVDAVALGHGFTPRLELAIAAGCRLSPTRFVEVDPSQRTSVAGVLAAGEITGIGGADLALAEGAIAGHVAAGGELDDVALSHARSRRRTFTRFARRIELAHAIGSQWSSWLTPDTIVCRCEEVTFGRLIDTARMTESRGLRSLKLTTRTGLGLCQGRACGRNAEDLLATHSPQGSLLGETTFDRRPIALPIRLGEVASLPLEPSQQTTNS